MTLLNLMLGRGNDLHLHLSLVITSQCRQSRS